jgi:hypothetical protein
MRRSSILLTLALALGALGTIATTTGCAEHRHGVYDSYHSDYHHWDSHEDTYYRQWLGERHYDYVEFKIQTPERQKEYWDWRHSHHDDHDRDHHDHDQDKH